MNITVVELKKHPNKTLDSNYIVITEIESVPVTDYLFGVISDYFNELKVYERDDNEYELVIYDEIHLDVIINELKKHILTLKNNLFVEFEKTTGTKSKEEIFKKVKNISKLEGILFSYLCFIQQEKNKEIRLLIV